MLIERDLIQVLSPSQTAPASPQPTGRSMGRAAQTHLPTWRDVGRSVACVGVSKSNNNEGWQVRGRDRRGTVYGQKWPQMKGTRLLCAHRWAWQVQAPNQLMRWGLEEYGGEGPPGVRPLVGGARFRWGDPGLQAAGPRGSCLSGPQSRSGASPGSPQPLGIPPTTPTPGCHVLAHLLGPFPGWGRCGCRGPGPHVGVLGIMAE